MFCLFYVFFIDFSSKGINGVFQLKSGGVRPAARVVALEKTDLVQIDQMVEFWVEMGHGWYLFAAQKDTIILPAF